MWNVDFVIFSMWVLGQTSSVAASSLGCCRGALSDAAFTFATRSVGLNQGKPTSNLVRPARARLWKK